MGLSRSSVDCDIFPEETLGNSLTPLAALGESLPLPPFPLPRPTPAHTWMILWETMTVRVMTLWPDPPHFHPMVSHSREENPHGMYMCESWVH